MVVARLLMALISLSLCYSAAHAQDAASITIASETQAIFLGDSVVLDIESTGLLDPLDVDNLKLSPEFLRETTGTRIAVVKGKVVEIAIRRMEFIPKTTGTLLYGPLSGDSQSGKITSNSVAVKVQAALSTQWRPSDTDLQSSFVFSNPQPIVGEQVILDIQLRHTHQIANERIILPDFTEFDVIPIFEQRRTIENDGQWRQIAWRYLVHAKRSGELNLNPVQWSGTMIKSRSQRGDFAHELDPKALPVRSAPDDRPDWWLPATSVKLKDAWSKEVITLSAGDEIIRTITLTANNVISSQLPDLAPLPTRALTSTLVRTTREHEVKDNHTVATGVYQYRMVAQSPIPVFLDTVRVPWWSVTSHSHEEAILPARRINVGLPDRADLLADLAINQSSWSKLMFKLRSLARWQPIAIGVGVLGVFLLLLPLLRDGVQYELLTRRRQRKLAALESMRARGHWQQLYTGLKSVDSQKHGIGKHSTEYHTLLNAVQQVLFADQAAKADILNMKIRLPNSMPTSHAREPGVRSL